MVARKPEDRYAHMGEVIKALEDSLGVAGPGMFMPLDEQAETLEACIREFHDVSQARLRRQLISGSLAASALLVLISLARGNASLAAAVVVLTLLTSLFAFILHGHDNTTHLYLKTRELLLGGEPGDWLVAVIGLGLVVTVLVMLQWFWVLGGVGRRGRGPGGRPPLHPRPPDRPGTRRPARPDRGDAHGTPTSAGRTRIRSTSSSASSAASAGRSSSRRSSATRPSWPRASDGGAGREAVLVPGSPPGVSRSSPGSRPGCGHAASLASGRSCNGSRREAWSLKG